MKYLAGYTDLFVSPVTGVKLPDLQRGYVWIGDEHNRPLPTFKLIDLNIDVKSLQKQMDLLSQTSFVISTPVSSLPKAQSLSILSNGLMQNVSGIIKIATPNTDYLTPDLPLGNLWIGSTAGKATPQPNISLDNLPDLGTAVISGLDLPAGKVWRGTVLGRPEESDALSEAIADILTLNGKFLAANFVMGDALVQATYPGAQFIVNLEDGMLKKTGKLIQHAIAGTDYLDLVNENYADGFLSVVLRDKVINRSKLQIVNIDAGHDNVLGINTLTCRDLLATVQDGAGGSVRADNQVLSLGTVEGRELILYDYNPAHRYTQHISLKGPASVAQNISWVMPDTVSVEGHVLMDIGAVPLSTDRNLAFRSIGLDARYILQQPHDSLTNAQSLNALVGAAPRILKATADGAIEIAIPDEDYATVATLEQIRDETEGFRDQAQAAAEEAATSATEAAASATTAGTSATAAAASATAAGVSAGAASASATAAGISALAAAGSAIAAGISSSSASSSASDASSSANHAKTSETNAADSLYTLLHTGITLQGAIYGAGGLLLPITTHFQENAVLPGNGSMTIPQGATSNRPPVPLTGMVRYNNTPS